MAQVDVSEFAQMNEEMSKKRIFISYSHKDEEWKDRLVTYLKAFVHQGDIVLWDDRKIDTGEDWFPAIKEQIDKATVAICLISANYLASDFINKEEIPALKRRRQHEGMLLMPILVNPCPWEAIKWLESIEMFPIDGISLKEIEPEVEQEKKLSKFALDLHKRITSEDFETPISVPGWSEPEKLDIGRLPQTGMELFGRQDELDLLDRAWKSGQTNIVSFVAYAGVGKSTLVNKWLERMGTDNYRGARRVYGWSFYSHGTSVRVTSADAFISNALSWFDDPRMAKSKASPWDKGRRLAELVRKQRTLLILDGLEPLQSVLDFEHGKIKDPALSVLVTKLAHSNNGLCVVTTREKVAELGRFDKGVIQPNLEQISKEAGRALLRVGGIQGTDSELEASSEEFGNHALAINLLGSYIHGIEEHHISNKKQIPDLDIPEEKGRHSRRIMEAFERRFGESPHIQVLRIMGLFDRPAHINAVEAMRKGSPIQGLMNKLKDMNEGQWLDLLDELRECKLLARKSKRNPNIVDCHPLVRAHFGENLQNQNPEAWKEAHGRLYEYYKGVPEKEYPDTLAEMEPLFAAVAHGCLAGRHQEVFDEVFEKRIHIKNHHRIIRKFGAVGADLSVLGCFFEKHWKKQVSGLQARSKVYILNQRGYDLLALGRLQEAAKFYEAALETAIEEEYVSDAGALAGHLSRVHFLLGNLSQSISYGNAGVVYMLDTTDKFNQVINLLTLADALHRSGEQYEAERRFKEADRIERTIEYDPESHWVPRGVRYNWFLLEKGKYQIVLDRTERALRILRQLSGLKAVRIAGERMCRGMALMLKKIAEGKASFVKATKELEFSVRSMRRVGRQDDIATSLLARAELYRVSKNFPRAERDLNEALEIVMRCGMRLFEANCYIEYARLYLAKDKRNACMRYKKARDLVDDMSYDQRAPELKLIKAELKIVEGDKKSARETLEKAKKRIDEMGCHRWDSEVERLKELLKKATKTK